MVDKSKAAEADVNPRTGTVTVRRGGSVVAASKAVQAVQKAQRGSK
jgi:hypothetical protein